VDAIGEARLGAAAYAMSSESARADDPAVSASAGLAGPDPALVGTIVHRLFQASQAVADPDASWLADRARALLSGLEGEAAPDAVEVVSAAVEAFLQLRRREAVAEVLDGATCHYELPFSLRVHPVGEPGTGREPVVVRGSIDCLAQRPDGTITVLELKTGRRQNWHAIQLNLYVRAARSLFPGHAVDGRLIYLDAEPPKH
jgi:ATP-dependent exoDNAse (exonuclease V) beta subunit